MQFVPDRGQRTQNIYTRIRRIADRFRGRLLFHWTTKSLVACLPIVFLTSCGVSTQRLSQVEYVSRTAAQDVQVLKFREIPQRPYATIASLSDDGGNEESLISNLKKRAAELGGDAILVDVQFESNWPNSEIGWTFLAIGGNSGGRYKGTCSVVRWIDDEKGESEFVLHCSVSLCQWHGQCQPEITR